MANKNYELLERLLDTLIVPDDCIDTLGRTYLDDLELIATENHDFDTKTQVFPNAALQAAFDKVLQAFGLKTFSDLVAFVQAHRNEVSIANLRPRSALYPEADEKFDSEPSYLELKDKGDEIERSNEFQKKWSERGLTIREENNSDRDYYEIYIGYDRMNPWTYLLKRELARGNLSADDKVLCIGNRWNGEIFYFRQTIGLKNAMGVDLISRDPELVVAADMHKMPFEDSTVKMVFCRGTLNKSYDIRVFMKEMMRVLQDGGYLALETPGPFGDGVNYLGRTDLKNSNNLLRLLKGHVKRIVYRDDTNLLHAEGNVQKALRILVQVDKAGGAAMPAPEPFPAMWFAVYDFYRHYLTRIRRKLRRIFGSSRHGA